MMQSTSFNSHIRTSSQSDEQNHQKSHTDTSTRQFIFLWKKFNLIQLILDRQTSVDNNLLISNDTFAFDNSLCGSNDDLQPAINTQPPPIPPRAPRTSNGSNKNSSPT